MEEGETDLTIEDLKKLHNRLLTDEMVSRLLEALKNDFTNAEASRYAGMSPATFYNYYKASSEFREKVDLARDFVAITSKRNIAQAVVDQHSVEDSWRYLERRQKRLYSTRTELTGEDGDPISVGINELKEISNNLKRLVNGDSQSDNKEDSTKLLPQ